MDQQGSISYGNYDMLLWQNVPGFDRNKPHILDNDIPHDSCEVLNPAYGQTCQASMVMNRHYEGCLCNDGVCPDGYTWDNTDGKRWCTLTPASGCIVGQVMDPTTKTCIVPGMCPNAMVWDGTQCNCTSGASWNGTQCVAAPTPPTPSPSTPSSGPTPSSNTPKKKLNIALILGAVFLVLILLAFLSQKSK